MFSRLMPQEGKFFDLFNAHAELIAQGGRELGALIDNMVDGTGELTVHAQKIDEVETRADKITHETIALLHTTFNTPLDRDEIHKLITRMDDILDLTQDVAETMELYDLRRTSMDSVQLAELAEMGCQRVRDAVALLSDMNNADAILKLCQEIDRIESDADRVMRSAMSKLFRNESDIRQLIKLKEVYELVEALTDKCEEVADVIEAIVLQHA